MICFEGIEKGSVVAVSTYMASAHDNREGQKEWFLAGYREMLRRIEPEKIICYNTPFPEMQGDIIYVDYERSSWRYMNYERKFVADDLESYRIGGTYRAEYDTMDAYRMGKGGGSAYGGQWIPNPKKPNEAILKGPPNTIQRHYIPGKNGGYWVQVKYGEDGWAVKIRHETKHTPNDDHTDPHDHIIQYDPSHRPIYVKPQINYPAELYPNGAPEFKYYKEVGVYKLLFQYNEEELRFKTLSEFKRSIRDGGEIVVEWCGKCYGLFYNGEKFYIAEEGKNSLYFDSPDELLDAYLAGERLRDIITSITVVDRAL